jgi:hypothetical protein
MLLLGKLLKHRVRKIEKVAGYGVEATSHYFLQLFAKEFHHELEADGEFQEEAAAVEAIKSLESEAIGLSPCLFS